MFARLNFPHLVFVALASTLALSGCGRSSLLSDLSDGGGVRRDLSLIHISEPTSPD